MKREKEDIFDHYRFYIYSLFIIGTTDPQTRLHVADGYVTINDTTPYLFWKDKDDGN